MKFLVLFFSLTVTSSAVNDCESRLNGICVHFSTSCPHGYGVSNNHCSLMEYCCYPVYYHTGTGSHSSAVAQTSSNINTQSGAMGSSSRHIDCESKYNGYCIDFSGSCRTGYTLSYSHCGFRKFCCHPFLDQIGHHSGTGSQTNTTPTGHNDLQPTLRPNTSEVFKPDACGISMVDEGHRIVGGGQTEPHEYPWQVSLRYRGQHLCGGTLIHGRWVLTAAHCFQHYRDYWTVVVGLHDIYSVHYSQVVTADRIFTHSGYSGQTNANDIALVRLAKTVDTTHSDTRKACLPGREERFDSMVCTVTGWGATHTEGHIQQYLQEVDVPIVNNKLCSYYLGSHIHPSNICAGYRQGGRDACQGDSGGPLVCRKGGVWKIVGIVSWGIGCGRQNAPGVYTRVSAYINWIEGVMARYQ